MRSSETLTTNLLKIERFAPMIHWAEAAVSDRGEAWAAMGDNGSFDGGFILSAGNVYSLSPLTGALGPLCRTEPKSFPTSEWDESEDAETRRRFVQLLNFTLRAIHYRELKFHLDKHYVFHVASPNAEPRKLKFGKGGGRTVFSIYRDTENKITYCRHYAAYLTFKRFEDQWYLEINPTYHYTSDGEHDSYYSAEKLSKMKRWSAMRGLRVFHPLGRLATEGQKETSCSRAVTNGSSFGQLATVTVDASIDERAWIVAPGPRYSRRFPFGEIGGSS